MKIVDLHNDLLTGCDDKMSQLSLYKEKEIVVLCAYFRGGNTLAKAVCDVNKFLSIKNNNCFLSFEDIGYTDLGKIEYILSFFPIYVSLTWNGENVLGYGCDYHDKDLKEEGIKIISTINQYNIALDCSHLSKKGFYTLAEKSKMLLCSHTAFSSVYNHKRNITDEQIKIILEKNGVIGLTLYSPFLSEKEIAGIDDFVKHIEYYVNKFGLNGLCIGTDFFGAKNFASNINNYQKVLKIVEKLKKIGYNREAIDAIFCKNALNFIKKVQNKQRCITK